MKSLWKRNFLSHSVILLEFIQTFFTTAKPLHCECLPLLYVIFMLDTAFLIVPLWSTWEVPTTSKQSSFNENLPTRIYWKFLSISKQYITLLFDYIMQTSLFGIRMKIKWWIGKHFFERSNWLNIFSDFIVSRYLSPILICWSQSRTQNNILKIQKQPPKVFYEKSVPLKISQNSQGSTCSRISFLIELQASTWRVFLQF